MAVNGGIEGLPRTLELTPIMKNSRVSLAATEGAFVDVSASASRLATLHGIEKSAKALLHVRELIKSGSGRGSSNDEAAWDGRE